MPRHTKTWRPKLGEHRTQMGVLGEAVIRQTQEDWTSAFEKAQGQNDSEPLGQLFTEWHGAIGKPGEQMGVRGIESILEMWCRIISEHAQDNCHRDSMELLALMLHSDVHLVLQSCLARLDIPFLPFYGSRFVLLAARLAAKEIDKSRSHIMWSRLASLVPELLHVAARGRVVMERTTALGALGEFTRHPRILSVSTLSAAVGSIAVLLSFKPEHFEKELNVPTHGMCNTSYQAMLLSRGAWSVSSCIKRAEDVLTVVYRETIGALSLLMRVYLDLKFEKQLLRDLSGGRIIQRLLQFMQRCSDPQSFLFIGQIFHDCCHGSLSETLGQSTEPKFVHALVGLFGEPESAELVCVNRIFSHLSGAAECARGPVKVSSWFFEQIAECVWEGQLRGVVRLSHAEWGREVRSAFDVDSTLKMSMYRAVPCFTNCWKAAASPDAALEPWLTRAVPTFQSGSLLDRIVLTTISHHTPEQRDSPKGRAVELLSYVSRVMAEMDESGFLAPRNIIIAETNFDEEDANLYDSEIDEEIKDLDDGELSKRMLADSLDVQRKWRESEQKERRASQHLKQLKDSRPSKLRTFDGQHCVLRLRLRGILPRIERRIRCPCSTLLNVLHDKVLAPAMGWCRNYHAYIFCALGADVCYGHFSSPEMMHLSSRFNIWNKCALVDAEQVALLDVVGAIGVQIEYVYDLGDKWISQLVVEGFSTPLREAPTFECFDGKRACPPEDCGGCGDYIRMLQTLSAGPVTSGKFWSLCFKATTSMNVDGAALNPDFFSVKDAQGRIEDAVRTGLKDDWRHLHHPIGHIGAAGGICVLPEEGTDARDSERAMFEQRRARSAGHCAVCSSDGDGKLFLCARCKCVRYCSRHCQTRHWKEHKVFCYGERT